MKVHLRPRFNTVRSFKFSSVNIGPSDGTPSCVKTCSVLKEKTQLCIEVLRPGSVVPWGTTHFP